MSCWKTPQNAGNSLSELQEIKNVLGGACPQTPLEARTFGARLGCLRILVLARPAALRRILIKPCIYMLQVAAVIQTLTGTSPGPPLLQVKSVQRMCGLFTF
jgi:hypothetical protein